MARRWWVRGIVWSGIGLATLVGVLLVILVAVTQSAYGRERVRQVAVRMASRYLLGSLHIGALRFGPGCALGIDSAAMRDPDDSLLVALGPARATCNFGALVRGRLIITSLEVASPHVVVRQSSSGVWNWSRAIRPDTTPPPPPSTEPARVIVSGPVRVSNGAVILEVPWTPPDSLRGAARDSAIAVALGAPLRSVRRVSGALVRRRELTGIAIEAPLVRTEIGDTTTVAELQRLSVALSDPPLAVHRIGGRIALIGDSAALDLPVVAVGQSAARASGRIAWGAPGAPAIDAKIIADTVAFGDFAWASPNVPTTGGGRFELSVRTEGGTAPTDVTIRSAELQTTRSHVRGDASVRVDSSGAVLVRDVALDVAPLHSELLRLVAGDAIPEQLRGALTVHIVARGQSGGRVVLDTVDARYADELHPDATNRLVGRGTVAFGGASDVAFAGLALTTIALDARTVASLVPALGPVQGRLTGTVTLDSTLQHLRITHADLRYAEDERSPTRLTGSGRIDITESVGFDLTLDARPLDPAALARSYPALAGIASFDGPIEIRGTPEDVSVTASLRGVAGSLAIAARYRDAGSQVAIRGTARVRGLDPRSASGRTTVPSGKLDANFDVDLSGDSLSALRGKATLEGLAGTVEGVTIEPSSARLWLTDSRIVADTALIVTSAGTVSAHGALGLRRSVRDTLVVDARVSLAELGPVLRAVGARDTAANATPPQPNTTPMDSARGTVTTQARVVGSLDSLDVTAEVNGDSITVPSVRASRIRATAAIEGLPATPHGRASLRADSVTVAGTTLSGLTIDAESADSERWRVALGTAPTDRPGGHLLGAVTLRADTVTIELDTLSVRVPGADLRLTRATRFQRDASGTMVLDTLELRGTRGAMLRVAGVMRDTGTIALAMQLDNVPVSMPGSAGPTDSIHTRVAAQATIEGTARSPRGNARAHVRFVDNDSIAVDSIVASVIVADERSRITASAFDGERSLLNAQATVPVRLALSPFDAALPDEPIAGDITIDSLFLPDITPLIPGVKASAGVLRTQLRLAGTARHPRATGSVSLRDGALAVAPVGVAYRDANAAIDLTADRITIREMSIRGGADPVGRAEVGGYIGLGDTATVDLNVRSATFPVIKRAETASLDVSTDLKLVGPSVRPTLSGRITVDRGVIRIPELGRAGVVGVDDTAFVRLVDSLSRARAPEEASSPPTRRLDVAQVDVVIGPNVWLRSADASIQLGGSIELARATPQPGVTEGQLALKGTLITQRGNYRLSIATVTRSFELEEGSVQFTGEPELDPKLNINAIYAREGLNEKGTGRAPRVRAHLGGTLNAPELTLSSADSKLTQAEIVSYLVTGQANFAVGNVSDVMAGEMMANAAGSLAQQLTGDFFDVVNVTAGTATGDQRESSASSVFASSRLGVGKQLSNRVFLKVDAGLCVLTGGAASTDILQALGVSLEYRFRRDLLGSVSSAPSTNAAACANQAAQRGTALTPRQWGLDFDRLWRF